MKRWLAWVLLGLLWPWAQAQSLVGEPDFIRVEREAVQQARQAITAQYQAKVKDCWQKFAVNACLSDARRVHREALALLRQKDLQINEQDRQWRTVQRQLRLQSKQPEGSLTP